MTTEPKYTDAQIEMMACRLSNFVGQGGISAEAMLRSLLAERQAAMRGQGGEVIDRAPDFWAAIGEDGDGTKIVAHAYPTDDGNNGEAARTEMNDWINENNPSHRLLPLFIGKPQTPQPMRSVSDDEK